MGDPENQGVPYFGVLRTKILLFRVLYWGPLFRKLSYFKTHMTLYIAAPVQDPFRLESLEERPSLGL